MGLYQFTRMSLSLCGAASSFQRLMHKVMQTLSFVTTYQDNTHSKHEMHTEATYKKYWNASHKINPSWKKVLQWHVKCHTYVMRSWQQKRLQTHKNEAI